MDESSKLLLSVALPTITVLVGILLNNRQLEQQTRHVDAMITSLRNELRTEISALRNEMNARFEATHQAILRVEGVLDARLKQVEDHLGIR